MQDGWPLKGVFCKHLSQNRLAPLRYSVPEQLRELEGGDLFWIERLCHLLLLRRHGPINTRFLLWLEYKHLVKQDGQGLYIIRKNLISRLVLTEMQLVSILKPSKLQLEAIALFDVLYEDGSKVDIPVINIAQVQASDCLDQRDGNCPDFSLRERAFGELNKLPQISIWEVLGDQVDATFFVVTKAIN